MVFDDGSTKKEKRFSLKFILNSNKVFFFAKTGSLKRPLLNSSL